MKVTEAVRSSPQRKATRQPLRLAHNNQENKPNTNDDDASRFRDGQEVLARWNDGLNYLGRILKVDEAITQCYIKFEDQSEYWALFKDITVIQGPGRASCTSSDIHCCVCQNDMSEKPNEIVLCDNCGLGYHQDCHQPLIDDSILRPGVPWICRPCVFADGVKKGRQLKKVAIDTCIDVPVLKSLPYDMSILRWDPAHKSNKEHCYCYCGGPGVWYMKMLQCCRCKQWFHEACLDCVQRPLVSGDRFYLFACSLCNQGKEYLRRLQVKWEDIAQLCLFNLNMDFQKKYYDFSDSIMPWISKNWMRLQTGQLEVSAESVRRDKVKEVLVSCRTRFQCGREVKKRVSWWALRSRIPPPAPIMQLPSDVILSEDTWQQVTVHTARAGKWTGEKECHPIQRRKRQHSEELDGRKRKKRKLNSHSTENGVLVNGVCADSGITSQTGSPTKTGSSQRKTLDKIIPWPNDYDGCNHPFKTALEMDQEVADCKLRSQFVQSFHRRACSLPETETDSQDSHDDEMLSRGSPALTRDSFESGTHSPVSEDALTVPYRNPGAKPRTQRRASSAASQELRTMAQTQARLARLEHEESQVAGKRRGCRGNVVDKSTLDAVRDKQVSESQLRSSVQCYFGAADRLAHGERYRVLARRVTPEGKIQYLVEWRSHIP